MRWEIVLLLAIGISLCNETLWACHKGGPMGFATNDQGGFSLDITLSPTFTGASTQGTSGCKDLLLGHNGKQSVRVYRRLCRCAMGHLDNE